MDKELLSHFGIFKLRTIARSLNIKSPTTHSRNDLIKMISEPEKHQKNISKKGRPAKSIHTVDLNIYINKLKYNLETKKNEAFAKILITELKHLSKATNIDDLFSFIKLYF